jgi:hypothetical protein
MEVKNLDNNHNCIICNTVIQKWISDCLLCTNCFHITSKKNTINQLVPDFSISNLNLMSFQNKTIKIIDLNFNNSQILDNFEDFFNNKKVNTLTVGITPSSFTNMEFKDHRIINKMLNRDTCLELQGLYSNFDIIIYNNIQNHNNPHAILDYCKSISNKDSFIYLTTNKNITSLSNFSTNSMNQLCNRNNLILNNIYINQDGNRIYEIVYNRTQNSNVINILYNEMINNYYEEQLYYSVYLHWLCYN